MRRPLGKRPPAVVLQPIGVCEGDFSERDADRQGPYVRGRRHPRRSDVRRVDGIEKARIG